ncbi:hypothetical protein Aduo_011314 [Ancylostoma duodenale]
MRLTLLLLSVVTHVSAELCVIKTMKDLEEPKLCTELKLDAEHEVMRSPMLFRKIKTATTYHYFKLCNSTLGSASGAERVYLPKGATLEITDNANLRHLPDFVIADGNDINLIILGNPKLDTTQLLNECKAKGCKDQTLRTIQVPYSCRAITPLPKLCHVLFGTVPLDKYDKSWDVVEVVHGTLSLQNSELTSFPKMEKLVEVEQVANMPVLIIENNANLQDVEALFKIDFDVKTKENAVKIKANPKLCLDENDTVHPFATEFLSNVKQCDRTASANIDDRPKNRPIRDAVLQDDDGAGEGGSGTGAPASGATGGAAGTAEAATGAANTESSGEGSSNVDGANTGATGMGAAGTGTPNGGIATGEHEGNGDVTGGAGMGAGNTKSSGLDSTGEAGMGKANMGKAITKGPAPPDKKSDGKDNTGAGNSKAVNDNKSKNGSSPNEGSDTISRT